MITTKTTNLMLTLGLFAFVAIAMFLPTLAHATTSNDVNDITKSVANNLLNMPKLIAMAAYVLGTFFAVRGLFALKGFIESPDDNPVSKVLGFSAVAALLIILPYAISVATKSIGGNTASQTSGSATNFSLDAKL